MNVTLLAEAWHVIAVILSITLTGLTIFIMIYKTWVVPSRKWHDDLATWRRDVDDFINEKSNT